MILVTTIKVDRHDNNISFTCDSYQEYPDHYVFNWWCGLYSWSNSIDKLLIKHISPCK